MAEFLEGDDDDDMLSHQEWSKISRHHLKTGFREGAGQAQDGRRQDGFNVGFSEAALAACDWSWLRGVICGVQSLFLLKNGAETVDDLARLQELLTDVREREETVQRERALDVDVDASAVDRQYPDSRKCEEHRLCLCKLKCADGLFADRISNVLLEYGVKLPS